jgi:hypothetical protein
MDHIVTELTATHPCVGCRRLEEGCLSCDHLFDQDVGEPFEVLASQISVIDAWDEAFPSNTEEDHS